MHAAVDHVSHLLNILAPYGRPRLAFLIVARRRFPRYTPNLSMLAQTFLARLPGDVSIFRDVLDLLLLYPLSRYGTECSGSTATGRYDTATTCISPPHFGQRTGGFLRGVSCGAYPLPSQ